MAYIRSRRRTAAEEDEGYFVSMSDMLTGLLFVFIILLMFFVFQFRKTTEQLTGAIEARSVLLETLARELEREEVVVEKDIDNGVLRLRGIRTAKGLAMFPVREAKLTPDGSIAVRKVADVLAKYLPCYTDSHSSKSDSCPEGMTHRVETLLIEGHTDAQSWSEDGRDRNVQLSVERAVETYWALRNRQPELDELKTKNEKGDLQTIISVSGYGSTRPLPGREEPTQENFRENRRIDLRFLMATPQSPPETARQR